MMKYLCMIWGLVFFFLPICGNHLYMHGCFQMSRVLTLITDLLEQVSTTWPVENPLFNDATI